MRWSGRRQARASSRRARRLRAKVLASSRPSVSASSRRRARCMATYRSPSRTRRCSARSLRPSIWNENARVAPLRTRCCGGARAHEGVMASVTSSFFFSFFALPRMLPRDSPCASVFDGDPGTTASGSAGADTSFGITTSYGIKKASECDHTRRNATIRVGMRLYIRVADGAAARHPTDQLTTN